VLLPGTSCCASSNIMLPCWMPQMAGAKQYTWHTASPVRPWFLSALLEDRAVADAVQAMQQSQKRFPCMAAGATAAGRGATVPAVQFLCYLSVLKVHG
jgi:hypothetical protein